MFELILGGIGLILIGSFAYYMAIREVMRNNPNE